MISIECEKAIGFEIYFRMRPTYAIVLNNFLYLSLIYKKSERDIER